MSQPARSACSRKPSTVIGATLWSRLTTTGRRRAPVRARSSASSSSRGRQVGSLMRASAGFVAPRSKAEGAVHSLPLEKFPREAVEDVPDWSYIPWFDHDFLGAGHARKASKVRLRARGSYTARRKLSMSPLRVDRQMVGRIRSGWQPERQLEHPRQRHVGVAVQDQRHRPFRQRHVVTRHGIADTIIADVADARQPLRPLRLVRRRSESRSHRREELVSKRVPAEAARGMHRPMAGGHADSSHPAPRRADQTAPSPFPGPCEALPLRWNGPNSFGAVSTAGARLGSLCCRADPSFSMIEPPREKMLRPTSSPGVPPPHSLS